jgi:hypothetical protein
MCRGQFDIALVRDAGLCKLRGRDSSACLPAESVGEVHAKAKHRVFLVRYSRSGLVQAGVDKNNNSDTCHEMVFFSP